MTNIQEYRRFISSRKTSIDDMGFAPRRINKHVKYHQEVAINFALNKGKSASFLDTGLGKSLCELEFAKQDAEQTGLDLFAA